MQENTAVEVTGLRYRYGDFTAVDGIDFTVRRGEIFALLGTNGAGKTTTLEIVEGFRRATTGTVRVLGHDPYRERASIRPLVGIMLQDSGLIGELTVEETLRLWRGLRTDATDSADATDSDDADDLLARVGLAHRADVAVDRLSGGERRRLDFAVSVRGRPPLVILDEPTTGLDPESRQRLWDIVAGLREGGGTILLTTHYLEEAEALADHVAIMHAGRVAITGTMAEVLAAHPSRITAEIPPNAPEELPGFVGTATATRTGKGRELVVETDDPQRDLGALIRWADRASVRLANLNATQASLQEIFLSLNRQESV